MDCRIVFYSARKTSFCERALKKSFPQLDLTLSGVSYATNARTLGDQLIEAFCQCDLTFIIGGLNFADYRSVKEIVSRAVVDSTIDECKKLKNESGEDGYVLRAQNQLLIMLPDEPEQIEAIMQGPINGYIKLNDKARV